MASILNRAECLIAAGLAAGNVSDVDLATLEVARNAAEGLVRDFIGWNPVQQTYVEYHPDTPQATDRDQLVDEGYWELSNNNQLISSFGFGNQQCLRVRNPPIYSVTSVVENPNAWLVPSPPDFSGTVLAEGPDYQVNWMESVGGQRLCYDGLVYRVTGVWTSARRGVQLTYVGGYSAAHLQQRVPALKIATMEACGKLFQELVAFRKRSGGFDGGTVVSESLEGHTVSYDAQSQRSSTGLQYALPQGVLRMLEPYVNYNRFLGG